MFIGETIFRQVWNSCRDYNLIEDSDKILVGLSGGKDSMALIEMLGRMQKRKAPRFSVVAAHIAMESIEYGVDSDALSEYCARHGVSYIYQSVPFEPDPLGKKPVCFNCARIRRKTLFQLAETMQCNKLALGHNLDDVLETFLLNCTFLGNISTMPPLLKLKHYNLSIIRPLYRVEESNLVLLANERQYPGKGKRCPYEKATNRARMKELLNTLRQLNPRAIPSLFASLSHILPDYLPPQEETLPDGDEDMPDLGI